VSSVCVPFFWGVRHLCRSVLCFKRHREETLLNFVVLIRTGAKIHKKKRNLLKCTVYHVSPLNPCLEVFCRFLYQLWFIYIVYYVVNSKTAHHTSHFTVFVVLFVQHRRIDQHKSRHFCWQQKAKSKMVCRKKRKKIVSTQFHHTVTAHALSHENKIFMLRHVL